MTPEQSKKIKAAAMTVQALADAIKSLQSVPSGHLYASVMGHMSLDDYNFYLGIIKEAGFVKEENYLLTWIGQ